MIPLMLALLQGTICVGGCSGGPMIYRVGPKPTPECPFSYQLPAVAGGAWLCDSAAAPFTAEDVAGDCARFTGDTETMPEGMACVGQDGLKLGAVQQFQRDSANLSPWATHQVTVEASDEDDWIVSYSARGAWVAGNHATMPRITARTGATWTTNWQIRSDTPGLKLRMRPGASGFGECVHEIGSEWSTYSCTQAATSDATVYSVVLVHSDSPASGSFRVRFAQVSPGDEPLPRCDAGAEPCTVRDAGILSVATEGWPDSSGRIDLHLHSIVPMSIRTLIDTRPAQSSGSGVMMYLDETKLCVYSREDSNSSGNICSSDSLNVTGPNRFTIAWTKGVVRGFHNGRLVAEGTGPMPTSHASVAHVGNRADRLANRRLIGVLRSMRVSELAEPTTLSTIGASHTQGQPPSMVPYPTQLQQLLTDRYLVRNFGISGHRTGQALDRWRNRVRPASPDVVVVWVGSNDLFNDVPTAEAFANLETIVSEAVGDGASVLVATIPPMGKRAGWTPAIQANLEQYNDWIRHLPSTHPGVLVIDTYSAMGLPEQPHILRPEYDSGDGLHHTTAGAAVMAQLVYEALE